jgi:hypothetical protein
MAKPGNTVSTWAGSTCCTTRFAASFRTIAERVSQLPCAQRPNVIILPSWGSSHKTSIVFRKIFRFQIFVRTFLALDPLAWQFLHQENLMRPVVAFHRPFRLWRTPTVFIIRLRGPRSSNHAGKLPSSCTKSPKCCRRSRRFRCAFRLRIRLHNPSANIQCRSVSPSSNPSSPLSKGLNINFPRISWHFGFPPRIAVQNSPENFA